MKISKKILFSLLVLVIASISYGQTLLMNFYQDDAAVIFKLQHIEGPAGSYGAGPFGEGPYKYTITPFIPFYKFFQLNPFGYFFVGFLLFLVAASCFYLLAREFFDNKKTAYFSTLIFAAGYVGSNSMLKISNSWQNNLGLIALLLLLWSLVVFLRKEQLKFYLLSLGLFLASVQFIFIRSHSLIFSVLVLDIILGVSSFSFIKLLKMIIRQFPFWVIFYIFYLKDKTEGASVLSGILKSLMQGKIEILATLFATTGNVFFPTVFQNKLVNLFAANLQLLVLLIFSLFVWVILSSVRARAAIKIGTLALLCIGFAVNKYFYTQDLYWYRNADIRLSGTLGMYIITFLLALLLAMWSKYKQIALGILFGLFFVVSQIFGYFIKYPEATFATTHRYLYYTAVGYSLILGSLIFLAYSLLKKYKYLRKYYIIPLIPLIFIVAVNALLSYKYQKTFVAETSRPTQQFYQTLKRDVPLFNKSSIFYFDVATDSKSQAQFNDFFSVGSMPNQTAIAIYYNVDRYDLAMVTDFNELLFKLSKGDASVDNTYAFYYGPNGLIDNTPRLRNILKNEISAKIPLQVKQDSPTSISLTGGESSPVSPQLLTVKAKVLPVAYPEGSSSAYSQKKENFSIQEQDRMISYLLSRQDYYKTVYVSSLSQWKYQETPNVIDNNLETSWRGHRIYWHDHRYEQVTFDLGSAKQIASIAWVNWNHTLTPTTYTIESSLDGANWTTLKRTINGPERKDGERVVENFGEMMMRFVRMDITATLSNDAPAISELEAVKASFDDVDIPQALEYIENPFVYIDNRDEMELIFAKAAPLLYLNAEVETDKGKRTIGVPIGQFSNNLTYQFIFNAGGTNIKNITVSTSDMPVKLEVKSAVIGNLSLQELKERGLIKQFAGN